MGLVKHIHKNAKNYTILGLLRVVFRIFGRVGRAFVYWFLGCVTGSVGHEFCYTRVWGKLHKIHEIHKKPFLARTLRHVCDVKSRTTFQQELSLWSTSLYPILPYKPSYTEFFHPP
jgi:hypothetical protein